ncbi:MAG: DUF1211 domain-containing protein [Lentisphaerae bacterium]|nr:DUF1211 domain-containing protein [Lentisphaerota bacterium]
MESAVGPELRQYLRGLYPQFFNYFLSFLLLSRIWVNLHRMGHEIRRTDDGHIWINIFLLMLVCLLPFSASLDAEFGDDFAAAALFHGNLMGIGLMIYWNWAHASRNHRLIDKEFPADAIPGVKRRLLVLPVVALAALLLSPLLEANSSWLYLLVPFLIRRVK